VVWLKATLAGDGIAKAFDEVGHSALPFTVATIGTDGFSESFDLVVEFHLVLGFVEVELVTLEYTCGSFAGGDFTDISAFAVLFW